MEALVLNRSVHASQRLFGIVITYSVLLTITGHAWLAWDTSWDENDLSASQALLDARCIRRVAFDLSNT